MAFAKLASKSPYIVFFAAEAVYIMAVAGRSSFGVAGLYAIDRFAINAATLSLFTVVQLAVYACAQIPVGYLLDRIGVRRVLIGGALVMATGQVILGTVGSLPLALAARVLIGLGDATAFVSVLRLVPAWFPPHQAPMMTQMTSMIGQLGQVVASVPFAFALAHYGWSVAFIGIGVAGVASASIAYVWVRNSPPDSGEGDAAGLDDMGAAPDELVEDFPYASAFVASRPMTTSEAIRHPGTWLGFWSHFTCGFPAMVFLLLWGTPFLQVAQGMSAASAAASLIAAPVAGIFAAPVIARLTSHHPIRRSWLVYGAAGFVVLAWLPFLAIPGHRPTWMVILLCAVLSLGGICSGVAFDFVRTSVHIGRVGTANGLANSGGFFAALLASLLVGLILDWRAPSGDYSADDFRLALSSQIIFILIGCVGIAISRHKVRKEMATKGFVVPPIREVVDRYRTISHMHREERKALRSRRPRRH
ncbi:MFS transporter [Arcanobacterium haemolyticum]|nr:MFS transporter [Arcanobacterium haemolyticum]